ncbi:MAG: hypothetical protein QM695_01735 [Micropruina sp.]
MTEQQRDPKTDADQAGTSEQEYGNLSVEDDPQGTTDPADLADTAGPEDNGGRENPLAPFALGNRRSSLVETSKWR